MDWPMDAIMEFLRLYQMHPCIWDPKDESHKNKSDIKKAWIDIALNMGEQYTVKDLKRKKESLMAAYRLNKTKIKKSELSGDEIYRPTWFAFEFMDNFLAPIYSYTPSQLNEVKEFNLEDDSNAALEDGDDSEYCIFEVKADPLHLEKESSTRVSTQQGYSQAKQGCSANQTKGYSRPTSSFITNKRRQRNSSELQSEESQIDQAITILKKVTHKDKDEEDECYYFGKIIEKKMRKLPEERRDLMMIKINQLLYDEQHEQKRKTATDSPTNSNM